MNCRECYRRIIGTSYTLEGREHCRECAERLMAREARSDWVEGEPLRARMTGEEIVGYHRIRVTK